MADFDQGVEVDPDEGRRHQADVRQRAVAPAHVGVIEEDLPELVVVGDRLGALARVGDRDERGTRSVVDVVLDVGERFLDPVPRIG